jgi:opacity protein-like surface antigen
VKTRAILATVFGGALLAVPPALGAEARGPGFELGARLGYAFAAGNVGAPPNGTDAALGDFVPGQWPLWLDAGYRFTGDLYLGAYFQYGIGVVNDDRQAGCRNANVDCSASDKRFGIMGRYQLPVAAPLSPWLGLGVGYEWGTFSVHQAIIGMSNTDSSWSGFEFANLQAGADYRLGAHAAIGPFVSLSFGQFQHIETTTVTGMTTTTTDEDLAKKSVHEWIMIGARMSFLP